MPTEAVSAIIDYGFNNLNLNRIQAMHFSGNDASGRVLIKAGMTYEGTLRQYVGTGNINYDCLMYSMLRSDRKIN
jgi:ribosomal-protein-alanine N-acetyltransferase